ncbi:MAG: uroporphyrinogen-III synthase [Rickettsiales bacterium]|nr:uroporphyrinogen-III synthase [Rickettsiales bacterium]
MTDKTILVTRPQGDELALTDLLHEQGYRVMHEPLTTIYLEHTMRHALHEALLNEPDAVIVTSRHAVNALALLSEIRDVFLLCVGEATAQAATSLGFERVSSGGGTAQKLATEIVASYDPFSRFLYVSGKHTRLNMATFLADHDMELQHLVVYEAVASEQLSDTLVAQLKRGQVDGVSLLSPRTAQIFTRLLEKAGIADCVNRLEAFCLSEAVAESLHGGWKAVHVTRAPTLASVVECVDNTFRRQA